MKNLYFGCYSPPSTSIAIDSSNCDTMLEKLLGIHHSVKASSPAAPVGKAPTKKSIYQNRNNFGVNFGSLFLLEKYIYDQIFINNTECELEAVSEYTRQNGIEAARKVLEDHWNNFVNNDDWQWLKSKNVTSIRIPIGYWHVNGGFFTKDTPFAPVSSVYKNSWVILKNLVEIARKNDIGVLIDLHALPGGANSEHHSGLQLQKAEFWDNKKNEKITIKILEFIAEEFKDHENIVGLQIINESEFNNSGSPQKTYYSTAINHIRNIDKGIPIIISDGWWTDQWVKWISETESHLKNQSIGVVIDAHIYRCFSDADKKKSPEQIIKDLDGDLLTNLSSPTADIQIGEFSCVLDGQSWQKTQNDRKELVKQYGQKLIQLFNQRALVGSYFWTFKFEHGDGGEWGFKPMVESGSIPIRQNSVKALPDKDEFNKIMENELNSHSSYWNNQNSKENYEFWRFKEGFITAWADASEFAKFNGSTIGRYNAWKNARRLEHINHRNNSKFLWEWDQGFDKGVAVFQSIAF